MKEILKKLIVLCLLAGVFLTLGKGLDNKFNLMSGIDPGPANIFIK